MGELIPVLNLDVAMNIVDFGVAWWGDGSENAEALMFLFWKILEADSRARFAELERLERRQIA